MRIWSIWRWQTMRRFVYFFFFFRKFKKNHRKLTTWPRRCAEQSNWTTVIPPLKRNVSMLYSSKIAAWKNWSLSTNRSIKKNSRQRRQQRWEIEFRFVFLSASPPARVKISCRSLFTAINRFIGDVISSSALWREKSVFPALVTFLNEILLSSVLTRLNLFIWLVTMRGFLMKLLRRFFSLSDGWNNDEWAASGSSGLKAKQKTNHRCVVCFFVEKRSVVVVVCWSSRLEQIESIRLIKRPQMPTFLLFVLQNCLSFLFSDRFQHRSLRLRTGRQWDEAMLMSDLSSTLNGQVIVAHPSAKSVSSSLW